MKINWGWGIAIFLTIFMGSILGFVYFSFQQRIELVQDQYYEKGLQFEDQLESKRNARQYDEQVNASYTEGVTRIEFPQSFADGTLTGSIHFYKVDNDSLDFVLPLAIDSSGVQWVSMPPNASGYYKLKIDLQWQQTPYYFERSILAKNQ